MQTSDWSLTYTAGDCGCKCYSTVFSGLFSVQTPGSNPLLYCCSWLWAFYSLLQSVAIKSFLLRVFYRLWSYINVFYSLRPDRDVNGLSLIWNTEHHWLVLMVVTCKCSVILISLTFVLTTNSLCLIPGLIEYIYWNICVWFDFKTQPFLSDGVWSMFHLLSVKCIKCPRVKLWEFAI